MVTRLGTRLGTSLGTDLGEFADVPPAPAFDPSKMYAILGYGTGANGFYQTAVGGGEAGVSTGFGALYVFIPRTLSANYRRLGGRLDATDGWCSLLSNTNQPQSQVRGSVGAVTSLSALTSSEVGKVHALILFHTGAALQAYMDHTSRSASLANAGFGPSAVAEQFCTAQNGFGATDIEILGRLTFRGTPSVGDLQSLLDDARALGGLPTSVPGATITHRVSIKETLAAANLPVINGQAGPVSIPDSVTAASVDAMAKVGSPVVRVIDPATPRLWSYETTPIYRGADGLGNAVYYTSSFDETWSTNAGFWFALLAFLPSGTISASINGNAAAAAGTSGFDWRTGANNTTMEWRASDGTALNLSGSAVTATNKINLMVGVWDGPGLKQRTYGNRAEVGTGVSRTAYAPPPAGTKIVFGRAASGVGAAGPRSMLGFAMGAGVPTLAQVQALYDAIVAGETMQGIPGMTSVLVDFTLDGGAPTTLTNRAGAGSFSLTGSATLSSHYARAYSW